MTTKTDRWTRSQLLIALNLYHKVSFGMFHPNPGSGPGQDAGGHFAALGPHGFGVSPVPAQGIPSSGILRSYHLNPTAYHTHNLSASRPVPHPNRQTPGPKPLPSATPSPSLPGLLTSGPRNPATGLSGCRRPLTAWPSASVRCCHPELAQVLASLPPILPVCRPSCTNSSSVPGITIWELCSVLWNPPPVPPKFPRTIWEL